MKTCIFVLCFACAVARAQDWHPAGNGAKGIGYSLGIFANHVYVGGRFTAPSNAPFCLGEFQSPDWLPKATGSFSLNGVSADQVNAIQEFNGSLYIGGDFGIAGCSGCWGVARWTGSAWTSVGSQPSYGEVKDLAVYKNKLYVTGYFSQMGGLNCNRIACWDGSVWSAVGGTLGLGPNYGYGAKLQVYKGNLYVSGTFTSAGGVHCNNIAKWNGTSWDSVGTGLASIMALAMAVYNDELYIGGAIYSAGGMPANCLAKWNGANWNAVGNNTGSPLVRCLAVYDNALIVAGSFTNIAGISAANVAKWNGGAWSQVGSGLQHDSLEGVYALLQVGVDLYACGYFNKAGVTQLKNIAKFTSLTASLHSPSKPPGLELFPNPASHIVFIDGSTGYSAITAINALGDKVVLPVNNGTVDVTCLPVGLYLWNIPGKTGLHGVRVLVLR
jgi:trimeric autotransporter adhesin